MKPSVITNGDAALLRASGQGEEGNFFSPAEDMQLFVQSQNQNC